MSNLDICYVILRNMARLSARGESEVLENVVTASVWESEARVSDMIDELLDMGCLRSTVCAETRKAALVLTDRGYGTYQEMADRMAPEAA